MSWKNQPVKSGVYNVRVYGQESRYWRYMADSDHWIKLESFQNNDSFKWNFDQVSGYNAWRITPFQNKNIGMNASPTKRPNGDGMYWHYGFIQGKQGLSANWVITASSNWSSIAVEYGSSVLDSRMEPSGGRNAAGTVHFYPSSDNDTTNQRWEFQLVPSSTDNQDNSGGDNGGPTNPVKPPGPGLSSRKGLGKYFEDLWFGLTPKEASNNTYDIIVIGTGMGAGVVAGDLFDTNSKLGNKSKSVLVIEKGGVPFHSHCLNAARPGGFGEDRGQQNDTFFSLFKTNYTFENDGQATQWKAGEMFNLGGRGAAWGLFCPRIHDETLENEFGSVVRKELVNNWYRKAETLMGLFNPTTSSYHASLMERLNMVSERECQWQWGRIASEFKEEKNFDFAKGAFSPIDKLLEIAMSKDRDKTGKSIEHENFKILINSDVRALLEDDEDDQRYAGVWVRDLINGGEDVAIKLNPGGKIVLGAGSVGSPTILMRTNVTLTNTLKQGGGLHLTDHDIFAATRTFEYLEPEIRDKVGAMKLQTYVRLKKSKRVALLNVAVGASSFLPRSNYPSQRRYTNTDYPKMIAAFILPEPLLDTNTVKLTAEPRDRKKRRDAEPIVSAGRRAPFNSAPQDRDDLVDLRDLTKTIFSTMQEELKLTDIHVVDAEGFKIEVDDNKFFKELELGGVAHELGTIPMRRGDSGTKYCVESNLRLRNTSNVYVCDLSIFPFSPEVNPTPTLVSFALRLSRHIHDPRLINIEGNNDPGSPLTVAQAQVRRWVMNQTGDVIKVHISNISGVQGVRLLDRNPIQDPNEEVILEPGEIYEVDRDNKTNETVRVHKLVFGIDWKKWKKRTPKVPENPFGTLPDLYVAFPQKVCAIE